MSKRYRRPTAKPGELKIQYGKAQHCDPDICFVWGPGVPENDVVMLRAFILANRTYNETTFFKELEDRGYDLKTLKFSVQKKASEGED